MLVNNLGTAAWWLRYQNPCCAHFHLLWRTSNLAFTSDHDFGTASIRAADAVAAVKYFTQALAASSHGRCCITLLSLRRTYHVFDSNATSGTHGDEFEQQTTLAMHAW